MNTLNQAWRTYITRVLRPGAPEIQRIEMRRAFYRGCRSVLHLMEKLEDQPEFVRKREIAALMTEHRAFMLEHDRDESLIIQ
jgi:hypothetical protein